jgi:GT2 family glycosyltransferase
MSQPALKALANSALKPFPSFSRRLYRLATAPDAVPTTSGMTNATSLGPARARDHSVLAHSLYQTAFGQPADEGTLTHLICVLRSGIPLHILAENLVGSPDFQMRHGASQKVDTKYITALYRDGLGRRPELEALAFWLAEGEKGATRANLLIRVASSEEALARVPHLAPNAEAAYSHWVAVNDTISDGDRAAIRAHIARLSFRPLISVIMAVGGAPEAFFRESCNSVVSQLYPCWELCIAVDKATEPLIRAIVASFTVCQLQIRLIEASLPFAAAWNAALNLATGEFVAFLRPGDLLPEHALYEIVFAVGGNTPADILYSDHDYVNVAQRTNPWFKPGWDPDLLLAQDYINPLAVYRRSLLEAAGYLRPGFEGAEFHDLALRTTGATTPDRILHVPAILYHKREERNPIDVGVAVPEPTAVDASVRAVREQLELRGNRDALVESESQVQGAIRIAWPVPTPEPLVSVIVPTRDRADLLTRCVDGVLHRTEYRNIELLIVDNGSIEVATFALFDRLVREENVNILGQPGPFNYSALVNAAAGEAKGEVLLLLNNDIDVIEPGWLRELVSQALRPEVGVAGAKLLYPNGQVQHGGIVLGPGGAVAHQYRLAERNDPGYFGQLVLARTLSAVTGACAAIRREVFFEVGGLDEANLPVTFNDVDLCLRVGHRGYRVVWTPFAELLHIECASRGLDREDRAKRERTHGELKYFQGTWEHLLDSGDPFHNPNLLFSWHGFEIPSSPRRQRPWY